MSLHERLAAISQEIRDYPTPIARCDQHLAALLEARARLLEKLEEPACPPLAVWANDGGAPGP